jgi:hypothetical protein
MAINGHWMMTARGTFRDCDGLQDPAPAPRLSSTPATLRRPAPLPVQHQDEVLHAWGVACERLQAGAPAAFDRRADRRAGIAVLRYWKIPMQMVL